MIKNIIREVAPENTDFSFFFDGDCFNENGGDYCYTLFIIQKERYDRYNGLNVDEYKRVMEKAQEIYEYFEDEETSDIDRYNEMHKYFPDIVTSLAMYQRFKKWANDGNENTIDSIYYIASFLSIVTNKDWQVEEVSGYYQGDYCEILYCTEHYNNVEQYGEIWLGCGKEFCTIRLDDEGNETDTCYGFIIADCQARNDEDYKRLVCEWDCLDPEETRLELIENSYTTVHYNYRTI